MTAKSYCLKLKNKQQIPAIDNTQASHKTMRRTPAIVNSHYTAKTISYRYRYKV